MIPEYSDQVANRGDFLSVNGGEETRYRFNQSQVDVEDLATGRHRVGQARLANLV
jgi:hypothetical protein